MMLLGPLFDCLPRRHFILPILIAQMYRQPVAEPFVHLVYASAQTRKEGSGVNGPAPSVTVAFGELRTNGERTESRRGVVSRAAFRPRGDHPVRAPVPALQAQLPRSGCIGMHRCSSNAGIALAGPLVAPGRSMRPISRCAGTGLTSIER